MPKTLHLDVAQVRQLIVEHHGQVAVIARALGVSKQAFYDYLALQPALASEVEQARGFAISHVNQFDPDVQSVREAAARYDGNYSKMATHFGVTINRLKEYFARHPTLEAEIAHLRTQLAESGRFEPDPQFVIKAIHDLNGNVAALTKQFRVSRATMQDYINRHIEVQEALYSAREEMLDMAETSLYRQVLAGQSWAVCFFLKTQGRKRGYIERGETFNLNVNLDRLSIDQLERLAAGEHPSLVLGSAVTRNDPIATVDAVTDAGASETGAEEETA